LPEVGGNLRHLKAVGAVCACQHPGVVYGVRIATQNRRGPDLNANIGQRVARAGIAHEARHQETGSQFVHNRGVWTVVVGPAAHGLGGRQRLGQGRCRQSDAHRQSEGGRPKAGSAQEGSAVVKLCCHGLALLMCGRVGVAHVPPKLSITIYLQHDLHRYCTDL
jgi:hypothetical protein